MPSEFQKKFGREIESGTRRLEECQQRRSPAKIHSVNFPSNDYPGLLENAAWRNTVTGCGA